MKTLFLVRHAKSSWENPGHSDEERPLNARGERDAPRMGKRLAARKVQPDLIVSSPACRAHTTAIKIAAEIGYSEDAIEINDKLYFEGTGAMLDIIHTLDPEMLTVMLFGHNPTMTYLTNELAGTNIDNVPTCGIAEIQFATESWQDVAEGRGHMQLFDYPKRIND